MLHSPFSFLSSSRATVLEFETSVIFWQAKKKAFADE